MIKHARDYTPIHHAQLAQRISKLGVPLFIWIPGRGGSPSGPIHATSSEEASCREWDSNSNVAVIPCLVAQDCEAREEPVDQVEKAHECGCLHFVAEGPNLSASSCIRNAIGSTATPLTTPPRVRLFGGSDRWSLLASPCSTYATAAALRRGSDSRAMQWTRS